MITSLSGGCAPPWPLRAARRAARLLLTDDFRQRRRLVVVLMTACIYTVSIVLLLCGAQRRIFVAGWAEELALSCAMVASVFYAVIRSGLNLVFREPSLAFAQAACAQTLVAAAYAVTNEAHAATLSLSALVMVFGMFEIRTRHVWMLMGYTIVLMGAVMCWCAVRRPDIYRPELQLMYFAVIATILPAISSLSEQLRRLRERLKSQKAELEVALRTLRHAATTDELTGLPNRRQLLALLTEHINRARRNGAPFAVALADLDYFKHINDTYGHRVGDDVLVGFARHARTHLRSTDTVGRWGGEEFLIILAGPGPAELHLGIERLRGALRSSAFGPQGSALRVTFSAGIAHYADGESVDRLVDRADKALYAAKRAGRDRSVTA